MFFSPLIKLKLGQGPPGASLFDRPRSGERAILVHLDFPQEDNREELDEFRELAASAGAIPVEVVTGSRRSPHPRYFVGSGKA